MKTKVRVKRSELLRLVEGRMRKAEKNYERARQSYPDALSRWNLEQAKRLEKLVAKARNGGLSTDDGNFRLGYRPQAPNEGKELCNLRRMVATLKIGAEDTILLSQEDADFYFGACKL